MSTVCEVIMAKALEMNVLGLTLAANEAGAPGVDHQSVVAEEMCIRDRYSTASSQISSEWTAYCNELLSKATIQIGSLAV